MKHGSNRLVIVATGLAAFGLMSVTHASELVDVSQQPNYESTQTGQTARSPADAARQYLMSNAAQLKLAADLDGITVDSVTQSPVGNHVRFNQVKNGMLVDGANIVVTLNHSNQVLTYINDSIPTSNSKFESVTPFDLTEDQASQIAYDHLKLSASPSRQEIVKKVVIENGVSRSVYQINLSAPVNKLWSWEIVVDASNARIIRSENKALDAYDDKKGTVVTANVFQPNPTIRSGKAYGQVTGYDDNNHGNTPFFDSMLTAVKLDNLTQKAGKYILSGPNVQITDHESPKNPNCDVSKTDMSYKRDGACFIDVSAYYFTDLSLRYLNETLGFKAAPIKYKGPVKLDPHGLNGDDNSHFDSHSDELAFGEGGIPDAQDHDVVTHELGHAVHSWLTKGQLSQKDGLSEGIGDYWAASYDRQFSKKGDVGYHWTFSFDGHNKFWPGRVTNVTGKYPAAVQGQIHEAGQMWATVCMEVYDAIGKLKTDKIHWTAISMLNRSSGQLEAAKAFVVAARQLYASEPATIETVVKKFQDRGFPVK